MSPVLANKSIYQYIKDGIPVEFENDSGRTEQARVRVMDFETPEANDFSVATQLFLYNGICVLSNGVETKIGSESVIFWIRVWSRQKKTALRIWLILPELLKPRMSAISGKALTLMSLNCLMC